MSLLLEKNHLIKDLKKILQLEIQTMILFLPLLRDLLLYVRYSWLGLCTFSVG